MCFRKRRNQERGAALITVLWLTTALAVIGFSVARTVREEVGRTENLVDGTRATLLARGGIERVIHYMRFPGAVRPNQPPPPLVMGQQRAYFPMPGGDVIAELLPESGKMAVNGATPAQLSSLFLAMGMPPDRAQGLISAILDWRTPQPNLAPSPTFWIRRASLQQIEELLFVPGITPDLYYGHMERLPGGDVVRRPGLRDVLSVFGSTNNFDINSVHPALMASIGITLTDIDRIVRMRRVMPFTPKMVSELVLESGPASRFLHAGQDRAYTVKATARPRRPDGGLSDYRRTVAALLVYDQTLPGQPQRLSLKQWYEISNSDVMWPGGEQ